MQQTFIQREARIGIDQERLDAVGIILEETSCRFRRRESQWAAAVVTIINISSGGIKLVVKDADPAPVTNDRIECDLVGHDEVYCLAGRVAWSESLANGQHWIGIELVHSQDALALYRLLTGREA